ALEHVRRGRGCAQCRGTGYRGRTGIFELVTVDDELRAALLRRRDAGALRRLALERGMRPLRADGWRQVGLGMTTVEEVLRVAVCDCLDCGRGTAELRVWVGEPPPPRPFHPGVPPSPPAARVGERREKSGWGRSRRVGVRGVE